MVSQIALSKVQAALSEARPARRDGVEPPVAAPLSTSAKVGLQAFLRNAGNDEGIPRVDAEALDHAVKDLESNVRNLQRSLQFSVDEESGRTIIKVIDRETREVIRQIPPAEVISIARRIEDAVGLLLEDEA